MIPVVGPFLVLGIVAWVVAIVLGVGSWMGLSDWRRQWALAGGLAGLGTLELYLYTHGGMLPVLVAHPSLAFAATAALFVGCGVAVAYGTLFSPGVPARPALEPGSAEETLWLHDAVDRLRPSRLDWGLTAGLMLPAAGMLHLGIDLVPDAALVVVGAAGLIGPSFGLAGLLARRRASDRLLGEIDAREGGALPNTKEEAMTELYSTTGSSASASGRYRGARTALALVGLLAVAAAPASGQWPSDDATPTEFALAMNAKILCSGVWVQGRDPALHAAADLRRFAHFAWGDDFTYDVDEERRRVTMSAPGTPDRVAQYNGDQGCSILPRGADDVYFRPEDVGADWPNRSWERWPMGERRSDAALPPEVDEAALNAALDLGIANHEHGQNTRAIVVVYKGRIIGERYGVGIPRDMPHLSWSQGKSITAALIGVLVQQGELTLDQRAPIEAWSAPDDPRREITIADLLHMSSGLDFNNYGLGNPNSLTTENHHFRIYFDGINVFDHAVSFPLAVEPGTRWRYLNSDPLTLGRIVKETVERRGESYHAFPWTALFDRIGIKNAVLETDAWGNFILTGFDYMSARDWARFGLLHLRDGVWNGERILPEGWVDFISTPAPANEAREYGGLFWLNAGGSMDRVPRDAYWPAGFMGQNTVIVPSRDLVVVRLGPSPGRGFDAYLNDLVGDVLDAIEPVDGPG